MVETGGRNGTDLVGTRLWLPSTEDGHVRVRIHFRCDDPSYKCRFAHLAWRIWPGVDRTYLSCRSALSTNRYPRQIYPGGINYPGLFSKWYVTILGRYILAKEQM